METWKSIFWNSFAGDFKIWPRLRIIAKSLFGGLSCFICELCVIFACGVVLPHEETHVLLFGLVIVTLLKKIKLGPQILDKCLPLLTTITRCPLLVEMNKTTQLLMYWVCKIVWNIIFLLSLRAWGFTLRTKSEDALPWDLFWAAWKITKFRDYCLFLFINQPQNVYHEAASPLVWNLVSRKTVDLNGSDTCKQLESDFQIYK